MMQLTEECCSTSVKDRVPIANCLLLSSSSSSSSSSSFVHYTVPMLLYSKPPPTNKTTTINVLEQTSEAARLVIRDIHSSVVASLEDFLSSPLLNKLLSLPSHFHSFSKIHKDSSRNVSFVSNHNFAAILPGDSVAGVVVANGIFNFLNIYNTLLIVRLVLTWFPNSPPAIVSPLSTLCDPYLNIFRGIIPPLGGTLDLSPILAFLVLNAFTSTAAALPVELPPTVKSQNHQISSSYFTSSQQKWRRRIFQSKTKSSSEDI